jgi:hypothetical protein
MMKKTSPLSWRKWAREKLLTALQGNKADPAYCSWQRVGLQDTRGVDFSPDYDRLPGKLYLALIGLAERSKTHIRC